MRLQVLQWYNDTFKRPKSVPSPKTPSRYRYHSITPETVALAAPFIGMPREALAAELAPLRTGRLAFFASNVRMRAGFPSLEYTGS